MKKMLIFVGSLLTTIAFAGTAPVVVVTPGAASSTFGVGVPKLPRKDSEKRTPNIVPNAPAPGEAIMKNAPAPGEATMKTPDSSPTS